MKFNQMIILVVMGLTGTGISTAGDTNWLWTFPIGEGHERYRQVLNRIARQPLLSDPHSQVANAVESYRCISMSNWGGWVVALNFTKKFNEHPGGPDLLECVFETHQWSSGTNDLTTYREVIKGEAAENLRVKLQEQSIFSDSQVVGRQIPDRSKPLVITADGPDVIIERRTKTSYLCVVREGLYDSYKEKSVSEFISFCYDTSTRLKNNALKLNSTR